MRLARTAGLARPGPIDRGSLREVLVLRLDRLGDVVMSLPALADLRASLPGARIRLAVGAWSEDVARSAPVDEVLVWNAPWVGRPSEGGSGLFDLAARARALRHEGLDLAIDLQGDVRAALLLRLSGARVRVGYANTGGGWLLTHVVPLDETVSWVEQNRRAVAAVVGPAQERRTVDPLSDEERGFARRLLANLALDGRRPLVGIHPSGGRPVKQWAVERWGAVGSRLQRELGATILVTGSAADRGLAARLAQGLDTRPVDLTGRLTVRETLSVIAALDLFLSPDTGPMHLACAAGTPSVSVFGPSDPVRYFSGGDGRPGTRHVVVRRELWCSPCNLIRKPPRECTGLDGPECLRLVEADEVFREASRLLRDVGGCRTAP
jgi:ADP-heptose:LPS heptosyltransferase